MLAKNIEWIADKETKKNLPTSCELPKEVLFNVYDVCNYLTKKYNHKIKKITLVQEEK